MAYYDKNNDKIYHVCANCPSGSKIEKAARMAGTPLGAARCAECQQRELASECEPPEVDE